MKRLMMTAAALALLTTAAHAGDYEVAMGMFTSSLYDKHCARVPDDELAAIEPLR